MSFNIFLFILTIMGATGTMLQAGDCTLDPQTLIQVCENDLRN